MSYAPQTSGPERPGSMVESHRGYDPRLWVFQGVFVIMLLVLAGGLAYQQLINADRYRAREEQQNQRRVIVPGPRGKLFDRDGRLLVGNNPRFAVTLNLDELRDEFRKEFLRIRRNYREADDKNLPTSRQLHILARVSVVQGYLNQINRILGRRHEVDTRKLEKHYSQARILPYLLLEDIEPADYARLLEQLPVNSPLQVYTSSTRSYPYGTLAAHTLGYTASDDDLDIGDALPGADLTTFKMRGSVGKQGLEAAFDEHLQGKAGGAIYRVDPGGYRIQPPLAHQTPIQGHDIVTSLDLDLQRAAEERMAKSTAAAGAAVALDIATGEVLVLASFPAYDLNDFVPFLSQTTVDDINTRGAWLNRATQGFYPPGSTFKLVTALAGLRAGTIQPDSTVECTGTYRVGGRDFVCNNHRDRGTITLAQAIEKSCNTFFYEYGLATGIEAIAAEARLHGLGELTGIELPHETQHTLMPDPTWKQRQQNLPWFPGDTANVSIGQGALALTPLQMACFVASFARGETLTHPTLVHHQPPIPQRSPPDGISPAARAAVLAGMEAVSNTGTGRILQTPTFIVPGLRIAGKTGTAQKRTPRGTLNFAWFVGFVPAEKPELAVAVMMEGDTPGVDFGGGRNAAPVAGAIFKAWAEKNGRYAEAAVEPDTSATNPATPAEPR